MDLLELLELPLPCLATITSLLWQDPADLLNLSLACRSLRELVDDPLLWRSAVLKRFGSAVCPGVKPPPDETLPQQLPGWVFYQGADGGQANDAQAPEAAARDVQTLEGLARTQGAEAFTTSGRLIRELLPQDRWRHSSFSPGEGMYVQSLAVQYKALQPPEQQQQAAAAWPPEVPGWRYFPSCISQGFHLQEAGEALAQHASLEQLLQAMLAQPRVAAITSQGEVKSQLRPQACWLTSPRYDVGIYVKEHLAEQQGLVPQPAVPDFRQLYARLHRLRCDAGQLDAVWLNDGYLQLKPTPDSPADSGLALLLSNVCWLDVSATIPGVPPGTYNVRWMMDVSGGTHCIQRASLSAEATPHQTGAAPGSAGRVQLEASADVFEQAAEQCRRSGRMWSAVSGGQLTVSEFSTVRLRFWNHDGSWKHGLRWAFVELVKAGAGGGGTVCP